MKGTTLMAVVILLLLFASKSDIPIDSGGIDFDPQNPPPNPPPNTPPIFEDSIYYGGISSRNYYCNICGRNLDRGDLPRDLQNDQFWRGWVVLMAAMLNKKPDVMEFEARELLQKFWNEGRTPKYVWDYLRL